MSEVAAHRIEPEALAAALDAYEIRGQEAATIVASLILLRWLDIADALAEDEAAFEDRPHEPLFPSHLQWRRWHAAEAPEIGDRLDDLRLLVQNGAPRVAEGIAAHVSLVAEPLRRYLQLPAMYLTDAVHWVASLPMETSVELQESLTLFDQFLVHARTGYEDEVSTPPAINRLMAAIADPQPGESVYDPCFGRAGSLLAAWQRADAARSTSPRRPGPVVDLAGVEIERGTFLIGLVRLVLGGGSSARLHLGDSLEREAAASSARDGFDVILANPPFGMRVERDRGRFQQFAFITQDTVGLFVQQALAQLTPHGRAVIAVPESFLFRLGAERELRRWLVEQGHVEAVVSLPPGIHLPHTGIKSSLLVLRKRGHADRIRMVDATPFFETRRLGSHPPRLIPALLEQLALAVRGLTRSPNAGVDPTGLVADGLQTGRMGRHVWELSAREIANADWDLQARRRSDAALFGLLDALRKQVSIEPLMSVAEVLAGVSVKGADLLQHPLEQGTPGYLRIGDLSQGKTKSPTSWVNSSTAIGLSAKARLRPADVLLSKSGTIGKVAVVRNGAIGAVASSGLYVVRANQERVDPNFLLAYLSSAACQEWLASQQRGTAVQHLNRDALDRLHVPVPPLPLQLLAAEQFQRSGTDVLDFLVESLGARGADQLAAQLARLTQTVPAVPTTRDATPFLRIAPELADQLHVVIRQVERQREVAWSQDVDRSREAESAWLEGLLEAIKPLQNAAQMPRGPSLFSVVQEVDRGLVSVQSSIDGGLPAAVQGRALIERLREGVRSIISDLVTDIRVRVQSDVGQLPSGQSVELTALLANDSALPLSSFRVQSQPDWGRAEASFLPERGSLPLTLRGDAPKHVGDFALLLSWWGTTITGLDIQGDIQLSFEVVEATSHEPDLADELGGSPYVTGTPLDPVDGNEVFFGREDLLQQISRQVISKGNVVLLEGNRRAGKTSILRHLEGTTRIPGWLAVYASLQGAEGAKDTVGVPTEAVFREIAGAIAAALVGLGLETPLPDGTIIPAGKRALGIGKACRAGISVEEPFVDFREYLKVVLEVLSERKLGVLLMLDEFDKLQEGIEHGVTSPQVPENIRFLIQTYPRFSAILTGSRRLKRLREEYWSALYGLGTSIQVTALDAEDAKRVVVEPVRRKLSYSPEAVDRILDITARQPYLLQCLCNRIFDIAAATRARAITVDSVEDAAAALMKDNEHFASLWDYAAQGSASGGVRRQYLLLLLSEAFARKVDLEFGGLQETLSQHGIEVGDEALAADLEYLRELDLVELATQMGVGRYRLAIPLMAVWVDQQHDHEVVRKRAIAEAEEEHG